MEDITQKLNFIKTWLGTGSINIFGLPMSGKDTQGQKLAELLDAEFLSSGIIIRAKEAASHRHYTDHGALIPTDIFYDWVLPYFYQESFQDKPLVLSSVGRWSGEETAVMDTCIKSNHPLKAAILLSISENEARTRFDAAKILNDRGNRADDIDPATFTTRLQEFHDKTLPVLQHYLKWGLLIEIKGTGTRGQVFLELVNQLYAFAKSHSN